MRDNSDNLTAVCVKISASSASSANSANSTLSLCACLSPVTSQCSPLHSNSHLNGVSGRKRPFHTRGGKHFASCRDSLSIHDEKRILCTLASPAYVITMDPRYNHMVRSAAKRFLILKIIVMYRALLSDLVSNEIYRYTP